MNIEIFGSRGSKERIQKGIVELTFDDGPHPENTLFVLKTLRKYDATATFFWLVEKTRQLKDNDPNLFAEILRMMEDNDIQLHGPDDYRATLKDRIVGRYTSHELRKSKQELEEMTGRQIHTYRPHYVGGWSNLVFVNKLGLRLVGGHPIYFARPNWSVETQIKRFSQAKPGSTLLMHDGTSFTTPDNPIQQVLPEVLGNLTGQGLTISKIQEKRPSQPRRAA